jgi:hypothetical protein
MTEELEFDLDLFSLWLRRTDLSVAVFECSWKIELEGFGGSETLRDLFAFLTAKVLLLSLLL